MPAPEILPDAPLLLREDDGPVARLTLNRPDQFNALSEEMLDALQLTLDEIAETPAIRLVTIGARGKAFCAGHDLKQMRARPDQHYYEWLFRKCSRMMLTMMRLPQPVIARVQGIATAAGCQLVANCDLAVASEDARFATSGIGVGLFCFTPGVALSRNVSRKDAFEMLFTGDFIDAPRAKSMGLVNRVVLPEALDKAVDALAAPILSKSAAAVAAGKRAYYRQLEMGVDAAYAFTAEEMARNMMCADASEGIDAFLQKRKPDWTHK